MIVVSLEGTFVPAPVDRFLCTPPGIGIHGPGDCRSFRAGHRLREDQAKGTKPRWPLDPLNCSIAEISYQECRLMPSIFLR